MFFLFRKKKQQENVIVYKSGYRAAINEKNHEIANKALAHVEKKLRILGLR